MNGVRTSYVLVIVLAFCSAPTAARNTSHTSEQLHFSAEDAGVQKPAAIPQGVLAVLRKDDDVQQELENENLPPERLSSAWFSASAIHLSTTDRVDLVVMARPPLLGANIDQFWIFRATATGYELVLKVGAHDLVVTNKWANGYRDIEMASMSASELSTVIMRFDGRSYKEYRSKVESIK